MNPSPSVGPHKAALDRILAGLFALLGLTAGSVLPRIPGELHRAVLRVLRPAESATRRLIVVLARSIEVKAQKPRPRPTDLVRAGHRKASQPFPLFDPRQRFFRKRLPKKESRPQPRISFFGNGEVRRISMGREPPPSSDGLATSANVVRRLEALKVALDDLPRQARRLVRALARRQTVPRLKLQRPLRPGPAPGARKQPAQEIDRVLERCHWLARDTLAPNTS